MLDGCSLVILAESEVTEQRISNFSIYDLIGWFIRAGQSELQSIERALVEYLVKQTRTKGIILIILV